MKLYIKNITREPKDTLYTFLYRVLSFDDKGFGKGLVDTTYFDPEFTKVQCNSTRHRSFDDIVLISKTYFKVSDKTIAKVIKRFLDDHHCMNFVLCDSIYKWVFYQGLNKSDNIKYCARYNGSNIKIDNPGKGVYSFENIINLMGLTIEDVKINY